MFRSARLFNSKNRRTPLQMTPLRLPGQSAEEHIRSLQDKWTDFFVRASCLVMLALYEWWRWLFSIPSNPPVLTIVAIVAILATWRRRRAYKAEINNLRLGRDGERTVGEVLDLLREKGYRVFHDILGPNFNIDHVLVGSAGIFTIETKTRSKPLHADPKIFYDGQAIRIENEHPFDEPLIQARAQARWLTMVLNDGRAIPFTVRPVVVFPGWFIERIGSKSNCDVWVLNPKALGAFLANEPRILTPALIDSAASVLTQRGRHPITQQSA